MSSFAYRPRKGGAHAWLPMQLRSLDPPYFSSFSIPSCSSYIPWLELPLNYHMWSCLCRQVNWGPQPQWLSGNSSTPLPPPSMLQEATFAHWITCWLAHSRLPSHVSTSPLYLPGETLPVYKQLRCPKLEFGVLPKTTTTTLPIRGCFPLHTAPMSPEWLSPPYIPKPVPSTHPTLHARL